MIFDKVMKCGDEHNSGFFTAEQYMLTEVGQWQAQLMQNIGYYWLENKKAVPSAKKVIMQSVGQDKQLLKLVQKAFVLGRQTQRAKASVLQNHTILSAVFEKFKHPRIEPEYVGVAKLLNVNTR